jgi:UDP-N-acetylglucosamine 2-epimerase (non-hydrolysing)/GDP/UDP-N,N'-diacetylbacillosamine 2-epimerase (hydrolysing)
MKRICVITGYRSDYTKLKSVLDAIDEHENLELKIIVFAAHTMKDCGNTFQQIKQDFPVEETLDTNVTGHGLTSMTKSIGVALIEISSALTRIKPDATLIVGDRYEIMAAALASTVSNIPLIHIQGGELSGTIDETLRHSITKLAHLHFPSTELSAKRIIQMGEKPENVYNVGCPALDYIMKLDYLSPKEMNENEFYKQYNIDFEEEYGIVIQHPVTTEYNFAGEQMKITLDALQDYGKKCILLYPNPDSGAVDMVNAIRKHDTKHKNSSVISSMVKNIPFHAYLNILKNSSFLIGNSSSGIREAHIFNIPVVNIGTRQEGRERTLNIIDVDHEKEKIIEALNNVNTYKKTSINLYGDGKSGKKIADIISNHDFENIIKKRFYNIEF